MKKTIVTSCVFPLVKLSVNVIYAEVKKPSGVEYIILALIRNAKKRDERLSDILKSFGIPDDLLSIFINDIESLLRQEILQIADGNNDFGSEYFTDYTVGEFKFTANGERLFIDGAIPTGEKKVKETTIVYNPLSNGLSLDGNKYRPITSSACYPENFMEQIETDPSGLKDYLIDQSHAVGLKKEERLLDCAVTNKEYVVSNDKDNLELHIDDDGMTVKIKTPGGEDFYKRYFAADMLERCLFAENKFKFNSSFKIKKTNGFAEFRNLSAIYLPEDYNKLIKRSEKLLLSDEDGKVSVNLFGLPSADFEKCDRLANALRDRMFITVDSKEARSYTAANVTLPERTLGKPISVNIIVEQFCDGTERDAIIKAIYDECAKVVLTQEFVNIIKGIFELTQDFAFVSQYADSKLSVINSRSEQAKTLLMLNGTFVKIQAWQAIAKQFANDIRNGLFDEMKKENLNACVRTIKSLHNIYPTKNDDLLKVITTKFRGTKTLELFNILTDADFTENEALFAANVIAVYVADILAGKTTLEKSTLSNTFEALANDLSSLKNILGIDNTKRYAFRDGYDKNKFVETYRAFKQKLDKLKKYADFARDGFAEINEYVKIMQQVFDDIMIERNSAANLSKINIKSVKEKIDKGDWRIAVMDMSIKLEDVLGKKLGDKNAKLHDRINRAEKENIISAAAAALLHELKEARNNLSHPNRRKEVSFDSAKLNKWADAVFSINVNPKNNDNNDKKNARNENHKSAKGDKK